MNHTKLEKLAYGHAAAQLLCFHDEIDNWYEGYKELVDAADTDREPVGVEVWHPIDHWSLSDVADRIDREADSLLITIRAALALAKAGIVATACEDKLSLDMNELDMLALAERGES